MGVPPCCLGWLRRHRNRRRCTAPARLGQGLRGDRRTRLGRRSLTHCHDGVVRPEGPPSAAGIRARVAQASRLEEQVDIIPPRRICDRLPSGATIAGGWERLCTYLLNTPARTSLSRIETTSHDDNMCTKLISTFPSHPPCLHRSSGHLPIRLSPSPCAQDPYAVPCCGVHTVRVHTDIQRRLRITHVSLPLALFQEHHPVSLCVSETPRRRDEAPARRLGQIRVLRPANRSWIHG